MRVPFYRRVYFCYSFGGIFLRNRPISRCISTLVGRVRLSGRLRPRRALDAFCVNKNAPAALGRQRLRGLLGNVHDACSLPGDTRFAVRTGPRDISFRGLGVVQSCNIGQLDVKIRSFGGSVLGGVNHVRATRRICASITSTHGTKFSGVAVSLVFQLPGRAVTSFRSDLGGTLRLSLPRCSVCTLVLRGGAIFCGLVHRKGLPLPSRSARTSVCTLTVRAVAGGNEGRCRVSGFTLPNCRSRRGLAC